MLLHWHTHIHTHANKCVCLCRVTGLYNHSATSKASNDRNSLSQLYCV